MIPQNSTVLVHRVAGHSMDAIIASPIVLENDGMAHNKLVTESTLKLNAFTETDDDEMAAIGTVIDAAEHKWEGFSSGGGHAGGRLGCHYGIRPLEGEAPPPGYVCRLCHIPGHFIQHCPSERKPPPPGYICHKCGVPGHFIHSCPNYGDRKYDSRRTCSLIPVVSDFADGFPTELVQAISCSVGDSLPAELHCPLCKKVMTNAMLTSKCCYDSFCDKCIRDYIIAQSKCVCGVEILADNLIPNQTLRSTIMSMFSSRAGGFSSGTVKLASSTSSNLDASSLSFTASAALKGDMKQHMDKVPLVTNLADLHEQLTHSDLQSKARESAKTSVKKTMATADAMKTVTETRYQNQSPPEGITAVSGVLERKVIKAKSKKKQKTAGATGNGDANCVEYDCHISFESSCFNSSFALGGLPWGADPYNMYFMPNMPSCGYPMGLYNLNGISNLPLHTPGMHGYPLSQNRELQPRVHQDHEASAHGRRADSGKSAGLQSHESEHYRSFTSTHKGGSKSRGRWTPQSEEGSFESQDYDEEFHSRKKARARYSSSPRNDDHYKSHKSTSRRRSSRRHKYEDSGSSDEENNIKRRW